MKAGHFSRMAKLANKEVETLPDDNAQSWE